MKWNHMSEIFKQHFITYYCPVIDASLASTCHIKDEVVSLLGVQLRTFWVTYRMNYDFFLGTGPKWVGGVLDRKS